MATETDKKEKMAVNGPVFFLIQEQAKSIVATQALQTRMAVLESLQERLMLAINDVHQHLQLSRKDVVLKVPDTEKKSKVTEKCAKRDLSKSDSLNKDSGISSDSSLNHASAHQEDDELLQLLEIIDERSLVLLNQMEHLGTLQQEAKTAMSHEKSAQILDDLLFEKTDVHRRLSEIKAERDDLRSRLDEMELVSQQNTKIQKQLVNTLEENQSLQERIHHQASEVPQRSESLGYMADIVKANVRKKYLQYSEKSRIKVSAILREGNVLELQKQLLTYIMENDILRAKLQQNEPSKMANWLKIEARLRRELEKALQKNKEIETVIQSKDLEIASLKDKIRCLEDEIEGVEEESGFCVKNFGMSSTDDWREPGVHNIYTKRSNLQADSPFSPLGFGDFSKTQSLPANILFDTQAKFKEKQDSLRANYNHMYDTGSFTEVPLSSSPRQLDTTAKDLVDLSSSTTHFPTSSSTLVQSSNYSLQPNLGQSVPNLIGIGSQKEHQNWVFTSRKMPQQQPVNVRERSSSAKLINGHLCWKGRQGTLSTSDDMSSICTEFDPLSDDNQSCEHFVDSLNLSIPLKPTKVPVSHLPTMKMRPQLSSIGDSLHSASFDLEYQNSSPILHCHSKMHARSVDGISGSILDKKPISLHGHNSVGPGRHMPIGVLNLMHQTSDYSLM